MVIQDVEFEVLNNDYIRTDVEVTVFCVTFNHIAYIKSCLETIIGQKTQFGFQIIVFDDCSTDGTTDIIREYAEKYPEKMIVFIPKENTYKNINRSNMYIDICNYCFKGHYVALCEGDDYWADNNKLQIQVDFLKANLDYSLVVHNVLLLDCKDNSLFSNNYLDGEIQLENVLKQNPLIHTSTMMLRKEFFIMDNSIFYLPGAGDYRRKTYLAKKGKVYYIDRVMSVYRMNTDGSWSSKICKEYNFLLQDCIKQICFLYLYNNYTGKKNELSIMDCIQMYANMMLNNPIVPSIETIIETLKRLDVGYPNQGDVIEEAIRYCKVNNGGFFDINWKNYKHVVIWGTGDYANRLTHILEENGVDIDSYAVADNNGLETFWSKKVYSLNDIPFQEETIVLVGIVRLGLSEMLNILKKSGIKNYAFPFLFNLNQYGIEVM